MERRARVEVYVKRGKKGQRQGWRNGKRQQGGGGVDVDEEEKRT